MNKETRDYIAFDLETTGLSPERDRVVEIGAVRFNSNGEVLACFNQLVNPERPVSPGARAVHGLADETLAAAPVIRAVMPGFLEFLGDPETTLLLAHNAAFDASFLGRELGRLGGAIPGHKVADTLALARQQLPTLRNFRLDTVAQHLGLSLENAHRALSDCYRVKGIWLALAGPQIPESRLISYPFMDIRRPHAPTGWDELTRAIERGDQVKMEYSGGTRGTAPRHVTPRAIVQRGGIAYLVGFCMLDQMEKNFRLDRVRSYEVVNR